MDASVVLAWCFPDEDSALAQRVAEMFKQGHTAMAPAFWPHEVLNALLAGEKHKRISAALAQSFLNDLGALPIELEQFPATTVFDRIRALGRQYGLTAYDAAYLDLSLNSGVPLATLDEDLSRACRKAGAGLVGSTI
jgi:predicted nucleic acid-binding protein